MLENKIHETQIREPFSPMAIVKSPMGLMVGFMIFVVVFMPKLMENMGKYSSFKPFCDYFEGLYTLNCFSFGLIDCTIIFHISQGHELEIHHQKQSFFLILTNVLHVHHYRKQLIFWWDAYSHFYSIVKLEIFISLLFRLLIKSVMSFK